MTLRLILMALMATSSATMAAAQDAAVEAVGAGECIEAEAVKRFPPFMPNNAKSSGYCCMAFDVDEDGDLKNIKTSYCSHKLFRRKAVASLKQWRYRPATLDGAPQYSTDHVTTIKFLVIDRKEQFKPSHDGRLTSVEQAMSGNFCPYTADAG